MLLRAKIFRWLVFFALVPSLIITLVSFYLLNQAIDQTGDWLTTSSPEMVINSLKLLEEKLSGEADREVGLISAAPGDFSEAQLDWVIIYSNGQYQTQIKDDWQGIIDSQIINDIDSSGNIRKITDGRLLLGFVRHSDFLTVAGGFVLDRNYLRGFEAASNTLTRGRHYANVLPAFILFVSASGMTVLITVIIIAWFLSRRLSGSITQPLEKLEDFAHSIASGDNPQPLTVNGTDEVRGLAETFNRMNRDLQMSQKRLAAAERVAAWQEFARRLAHELKNPLTPISLSLYRLRQGLEKEGRRESYAEMLEAIEAEVGHLERLAEDYSSLAQLPEPSFSRFDIVALIKEIVRLHQSQLDDFDFNLKLPETTLEIEGDADRLREVIVNLVKNALTFTPAGQSVTVNADIVENWFDLKISNQAETIDENILAQAKTPYFTTYGGRGGTGLGLAIAEKIITDHGGTLNLQKFDDRVEVYFRIPSKQSGSLP